MTMQQRWAEGPDIGTPPRHHPTSTDHLIDVLAQLRDELIHAAWVELIPVHDARCDTAASRAIADADAILKTYGR